jgi:hypothetical protein
MKFGVHIDEKEHKSIAPKEGDENMNTIENRITWESVCGQRALEE